MPIKTPGGILEVEDAKLRASYLLANTSVGIGTSTTVPDGASLYIDEDNPTIRFQEGTTTSAARILAKSGTLRLESGTDYDQPDLTGDIAFSNIQGGTTHMIIKGDGNVGIGKESPSQMLDVSGNVQVGTANLFVDTTTGRVGVGMTDPGHNLDIVSEINLRSVSNTASIKYNSNVVTEYVRSKKLIKYPRVAMTANSSGGYVASASSERTTDYQAYKAFNMIWNSGSYTDGWVNETNVNYDGTDNAYNPSADTPTRNLGTGAVDGEWLKLELPVKVLLQNFKIYARWNDPTRAPEDFKVYGSNDNTNWVELLSKTGQQPPATGQEYTVDTNTHYKYFGLVVTKIYGQNNYFAIDQVEYYGTPEYDPEVHGTDVIARCVPNVPNTDWLEVYYDAKSLVSMPTTVSDLANSNNGTVDGVTFDTTNNIESFVFDGVNDTIQSTFSGHSLQSGYTMSLWINPINMAHDDYVATFGVGSTGTAFGINFENTGGLRAFIWGSSTPGIVAETTNNTINNSEWIHVTATFVSSSGDINLYINSSVVATGSGTALTSISSSAPLVLGARNDNGTINRHANVKIANFRLFNRALTADEVWQLYAYQKDYFQVSPDVVTFKGGRLGVGTSEPQAVLDVMGDVRYIRLTPRPAVSARQLFLNGTTQDGVYPISGVAGGTAYPVYCKMDPQHYGGFWMCFAQIPINTNGPINFFSDAYGNSGDLLATNLFSAPISILSNNDYGTDIDVMLELDGRGMRRTTGNKVGGIWRGIYLSQALDTSYVGTVSTSTHAYTADGISWTNGGAATFTKANSSWNVAISTNGNGDYAYNDYNEARGGWIIHGLSGYDLGCVYGRAMRGNDAIDMGASTDWAVARIFVRPTQT